MSSVPVDSSAEKYPLVGAHDQDERTMPSAAGRPVAGRGGSEQDWSLAVGFSRTGVLSGPVLCVDIQLGLLCR